MFLKGYGWFFFWIQKLFRALLYSGLVMPLFDISGQILLSYIGGMTKYGEGEGKYSNVKEMWEAALFYDGHGPAA